MVNEGNSFRAGWYGIGSVWGQDETYALISKTDLPTLPKMVGLPFDWIPALPEDDDPLNWADEGKSRQQGIAWLDSAAAEAANNGLSIPASFITFMTTSGIHTRVPTCTLCELDVSNRLLASPAGADHRFIRFMNDQQSVLLWYLHLQPNGGHEVVVAMPEWRENPGGETLDDAVDINEFITCASSFEDFVHRWWLENTIFYSQYAERKLTSKQQAYVDAARTREAPPR